jgi:hypothetical protein
MKYQRPLVRCHTFSLSFRGHRRNGTGPSASPQPQRRARHSLHGAGIASTVCSCSGSCSCSGACSFAGPQFWLRVQWLVVRDGVPRLGAIVEYAWRVGGAVGAVGAYHDVIGVGAFLRACEPCGCVEVDVTFCSLGVLGQ